MCLAGVASAAVLGNRNGDGPALGERGLFKPKPSSSVTSTTSYSPTSTSKLPAAGGLFKPKNNATSTTATTTTNSTLTTTSAPRLYYSPPPNSAYSLIRSDGKTVGGSVTQSSTSTTTSPYTKRLSGMEGSGNPTFTKPSFTPTPKISGSSGQTVHTTTTDTLSTSTIPQVQGKSAILVKEEICSSADMFTAFMHTLASTSITSIRSRTISLRPSVGAAPRCTSRNGFCMA